MVVSSSRGCKNILVSVYLVVPSYNNTIIGGVLLCDDMVNDDDYYRSEQCAVFGSTHEHHKICMQSRYGELICNYYADQEVYFYSTLCV